MCTEPEPSLQPVESCTSSTEIILLVLAHSMTEVTSAPGMRAHCPPVESTYLTVLALVAAMLAMSCWTVAEPPHEYQVYGYATPRMTNGVPLPSTSWPLEMEKPANAASGTKDRIKTTRARRSTRTR